MHDRDDGAGAEQTVQVAEYDQNWLRSLIDTFVNGNDDETEQHERGTDGADTESAAAGCTLWDLCSSADTAAQLISMNIVSAVCTRLNPRILRGQDNRTNEICVGILSNIVIHSEADQYAKVFLSDTAIQNLLLETFRCSEDARTLTEFLRLFCTLISKNAAEWKSVLSEAELIQKVSFILHNGIPQDLLLYSARLVLQLAQLTTDESALIRAVLIDSDHVEELLNSAEPPSENPSSELRSTLLDLLSRNASLTPVEYLASWMSSPDEEKHLRGEERAATVYLLRCCSSALPSPLASSIFNHLAAKPEALLPAEEIDLMRRLYRDNHGFQGGDGQQSQT
eukprot:CAMPEP_0198724918 /NCGR_PEP_ID=MMETSP1475-20131203/2311_1 /TAXON_ID= ORGANISM="Unidentified sp., Strain CCMP1999" /NCGR_SAMPLE_ID=MMETSP1475 /ASSEMBLY_ACC=CAM_ASM_001111 /LENGTH=338 /DNA_ID=CAMNT_0044486557 /DNA_START=38 /DNA_END=1054 /DNA_ORIENTATION=-